MSAVHILCPYAPKFAQALCEFCFSYELLFCKFVLHCYVLVVALFLLHIFDHA